MRDPAEIQAFLPLLRVDEGNQRGSCMCCGQPTIELYRGERLVAEIGFHHGQSLRWRGWTNDGWMTETGADALCKWLGERGVEACADRKAGADPTFDWPRIPVRFDICRI